MGDVCCRATPYMTYFNLTSWHMYVTSTSYSLSLTSTVVCVPEARNAGRVTAMYVHSMEALWRVEAKGAWEMGVLLCSMHLCGVLLSTHYNYKYHNFSF